MSRRLIQFPLPFPPVSIRITTPPLLKPTANSSPLIYFSVLAEWLALYSKFCHHLLPSHHTLWLSGQPAPFHFHAVLYTRSQALSFPIPAPRLPLRPLLTKPEGESGWKELLDWFSGRITADRYRGTHGTRGSGEKGAGEKGKRLTCRKVRSSEPSTDAAMLADSPANHRRVPTPETDWARGGACASKGGPGAGFSL